MSELRFLVCTGEREVARFVSLPVAIDFAWHHPDYAVYFKHTGDGPIYESNTPIPHVAHAVAVAQGILYNRRLQRRMANAVQQCASSVTPEDPNGPQDQDEETC